MLASPFMQTLLALTIAFVLATAIGFERQWRQRTAGLRTNVLVALGRPHSPILGCACLERKGRRGSSPT